jgi:hypothetical protein
MLIGIGSILERTLRLGNRQAMHHLTLHPDCLAGPITAISASIEPTKSGCRTTFRATGDLDSIIIPAGDGPLRTDNLWKTTCFEIFWQPRGGAYYREFNLSPSTRWACYDFDDFRLNSRDGPAQVVIQCRREGDALIVEADITSELPLPADVALNGIIEDKQGNIQFWALAFQPGKAEFHSKVCRILELEGPKA